MTNTNQQPNLVQMYHVDTNTTFEEWQSRFPWLMWDGRKNGVQGHAVDPVALLITGVNRTFTGSTIPDHAEPLSGKVTKDEFGMRCMRSLFDKLFTAAEREETRKASAAERAEAKQSEKAEKASKAQERQEKAKAKADAKAEAKKAQAEAKKAKEAAKEVAKTIDTNEMVELKCGVTKSGEFTVKQGRVNIIKTDLGEVAAEVKKLGIAFNPEKAKAYLDGNVVKVLQSGAVVWFQTVELV